MTGTTLQPLEGDTEGALRRSVEQLQHYLRRTARVVALGDRDLADDLYALALCRLWELDPSRFDTCDVKYLCRALVNWMKKAARPRLRDIALGPLTLRPS